MRCVSHESLPVSTPLFGFAVPPRHVTEVCPITTFRTPAKASYAIGRTATTGPATVGTPPTTTTSTERPITSSGPKKRTFG